MRTFRNYSNLPTYAKRYTQPNYLIKQLMENFTSYQNDNILCLLTQGSFLKLLHLEQTDTSWTSFLYCLSKSVMSFVLGSFIDCLPSLAALKRMNKRSTTRCIHICNNHETLHLILNCCSVYLNQGHYTWWHNSVLQHFVLALGWDFSFVNSPPDPQNYAALP